MRQRLFWIIAALIFLPNCVFILGMWWLEPQSNFLSIGARIGWLLLLVLIALSVGSLLTSALLRAFGQSYHSTGLFARAQPCRTGF
ncbi:hypothetical protein [Calidithermus roseus]|uniref:Uncharacterized protein n=1 Tax=Calidithermus roseus TaxID=1644118 RepID=A0A399ELG8_9DEIN|nr:hypothetical protein [Calidithermus roseus]RIH83909.1 hypothetical protein Mrose_02868 [Calidithermus roseus]